MNRRYDNLTKPLRLRGKTMKSRIIYPVAQPHFLQADEKYPTEAIIEFYKNRAKNGAGLILLHDLTNQNQRLMGRNGGDTGHFAMYDLDDLGSQNGFTQFAEYMHMFGTLVCPEINMDNRIPVQVNDPDVPAPKGAGRGGIGPGGIGGTVAVEDDEDEPPRQNIVEMMDRELESERLRDLIPGSPGMPKRLEVEEGRFIGSGPGQPKGGMQLKGELMEYYLSATIKHAKTYYSLNYDGGLINFSSSSFMVGELFYPRMNWRTDEYGGSLENRIRFPVELVKRVRMEMGEDYILCINCPNIDNEFTEEDCAVFLKEIDPYIDVIQLRTRGHADHDPYPVCLSAEQASRLKALGVQSPIFVSTYYKDLDSLDSIIGSGQVDGIAPGHLMICNDALGEILRDGNGEDVRPCIECHNCRGTHSDRDWMSHCTINPHIGMEHQEFRFVSPVTTSKRVAIVGGGPGGMNCALYLAGRGHTPVIFEASGELGGQIKSANYPQFKWELKRYLDWLKNQMVRKGIEIRFNTLATPEMIESEGFDAVVVAIGGHACAPKIEGAQECKWNGTNIYGHIDELGRRVIVIGGSSTAAEAACYLAESGREVVELSRQLRIAYDLNPVRTINYMNQKAQKLGVKIKKKCQTLKIESGIVTYSNYKGEIKQLECDDVVVNGGIVPDFDKAASFRNCAREYYVIGDARQPGTMRHAVRDACAVALQI